MRKEIEKCLEVLRSGGTILYPTDTIWGIGCDATRVDAVARVYEIKERVDTKVMLVLVDNIDMIYDYIEEMPEMALEILEQLQTPQQPGPDGKSLTIVYPGARGLAGNLIASDGSVGIRITTEEFSRHLITAFGKPIVSSSANIAGEVAPGNYSEISEHIRSSVDYQADWKRDERKQRKPSGILKVSLNGEVKVIRE
jgi:L-threonylcarbamoyladenylate synthase